MDYFIVVGLVFEVLIFSWVDQKLFGTWYTPFNLLAYPYMFVVVSAFLLAPWLGFVSVYTPSILIWIVGLLFFWSVGFTLGLICDFRSNSHPATVASKPANGDHATVKIATRVGWAIIPILALNFYRTIAGVGGWSEIGSLDFRTDYSHGVSSHAVVLAFPLVVLLIGTYRRGRKQQLVLIAILLLFLFASQVKGTLLAPLVGGMLFRAIRGDLKLSLKKVGAAVGLSYALFNAVYLLGFSFANSDMLFDSNVYGYLSRHYMYYLWSGVLSLSEAIRTGVGSVGGHWYEIFSAFMNLYRATLSAGPLVGALSPRAMGMSVDLTVRGFQGVNVYTMLGTLYLYLGPFPAMIFMVGIAIIFYVLLLVSRVNNNAWYLTLYCAMVSWLVFGFFEYYLWHLNFIEMPVYTIILAALSQRYKGSVKRTNTVAISAPIFGKP